MSGRPDHRQSGHGPDSWSRLARFDHDHPSVSDAALALGVAAAAGPWLALHQGGGAREWVCYGLLVVPLVWRRRHPTAVFGVLAAVAFVQWLTVGPLLADVSLLLAAYTVALERSRWETWGAWLVLEVGAIMGAFRWHFTGSWVRSLVGLSGLSAAAVLAGLAYRARRTHLQELTHRAERLESERDTQARMAAAAERTRIAREMHDVIAHSLAVMITMAEGAAAKLDRDPALAAEAIDSVVDVGRQALDETRRLVGVLREQDGSPELSPQPGLDQLGDLLAQVRRAGLEADMSWQGDPFQLSPGAAMTVYRIVQEATTNTLKHASGATRLAVTLSYQEPEVRVEVVDDGSPPAGGPEGVPSAAGHGLVGMGERLAMYGGRLDAGPAAQGGWAVRAWLRAPGPPSDGRATGLTLAGRPVMDA